MRTLPDTAVRELDHRSNGGIDVRLLWNSQTNLVSVAVEDERAWRDPLSSVRSVCELGGPRASACQSGVAARAARPAASARSPWRWPRLA